MPTLPDWSPLIVIAAVAVATAVGLRLSPRDAVVRETVFPTLVDTVVVGLLAARLGYVVQWWPSYAADPWSIVRIGDGGFLWWMGVPASLAFLAWRMRRVPAARRALAGAVLAGALTWAAGTLLSIHFDSAPPQIPQLALQTLEGEAVSWGAEQGRPRVLNLWATWCPPCRRELPAFVDAQRARPDIEFVLLNQGESAAEVADYLTRAALPGQGVLLDGAASASQALAVRAYPATYFYDAEGRLLDRHYGELTAGGLAGKLQSLFGDAP